MTVFCSNCGTKGEEDARVCANCGAPLEYDEMPVQMNTADTAMPMNNPMGMDNPMPMNNPMGNTVVAPNKGNGSAKVIIGVAAIAVALIVAVVGGVSVISANGYKSVIKDKLDAIENLDSEKLAQTYPEFMYNTESYYGYESYEDFVDAMEDYGLESIEDGLFEKLEKKAGDDLKFSYKIEKIEKLSDNKFKKFCEGIEEECDYNVKNIKAIKKADIRVKVKGSDDTYEFDWKDVYLIKDDGKWYLLNDDLENGSLGKKTDYHRDYYNWFKSRVD